MTQGLGWEGACQPLLALGLGNGGPLLGALPPIKELDKEKKKKFISFIMFRFSISIHKVGWMRHEEFTVDIGNK